VQEKDFNSSERLAILTASGGQFHLICLIEWDPFEDQMDKTSLFESTVEFCGAISDRKQPGGKPPWKAFRFK